VITRFLYDLTLGIPLRLTRDILEKIWEEIEREQLLTEESIKERLQQLLLMLQEGEIDEEEYEKLEDRLMERLRAVRQHRKGG
jgi:hypothetical protein